MSRLTRLAALWTLLLHVVVAGVLPFADARAEAASRSAEARVHVEAPGSGNCLALHDELTCQLCSFIRLSGPAGQRVALPEVRRVAGVPVEALESRAVDRPVGTRLRARAPPVA